MDEKDSPSPHSFPAEDSYFLEIESHFADRRGTPFIVSAKDWALMKGWRDEGIPLSVVIEGISSAFDHSSKAGRRRAISSLSYCRHAVKDLWRERKDLLVGGEGALPENDAATQLAALADEVAELGRGSETPAAGAFEWAASSILDVHGALSIPDVENRLGEVEEEFFDRLSAALPATTREEMERQITESLATYGDMDAQTLERTRAASRKRLIRKEFQVPRLSLFR